MAQYSVDIVAKVLGGAGIDDLAKKLRGVEGAAEQSQQAVQGMSSGLGALKTAIAGLGLGLLAKNILQTTSNIEQIKLGLEAFTGSTQQAEAAYAAFRHIAVESPFDTQQVASAGKTLLAFGMDARTATENVRSLSMIAGATGAPLENLAFNLGQIRTLGKATSMDLKQFAMAGIPIYEELAKVMYGTADAVAKVQDDVSNGVVSYQQVEQAIKNLTKTGSSYEELSKKQLYSLQGLWATLVSAIDEVSYTLGKAFAPDISKALGGFIGMIEVMAKWMMENGKAIAATVKSLFEMARVIGPVAAGIWVVVKAYQAWQAISKALAITQAFLLGLTGKGLLLVAAAGAAAAGAAVAIDKGMEGVNEEVKRMQAESTAAGDKWAQMLQNLGPAKDAAAGVADATADGADAATKFKDEVAKLKDSYDLAGQALDRIAAKQQLTQSIATAKLGAEQALNNLMGERLQREYDAAKTADDRFNIAVRMFNQQVQAAELEYKQALLNNKAAVDAAVMQEKKVELTYKQMQAERDLAAARGQDVSAYDQALGNQKEAVNLAKEQLSGAREIEKYSNQTALALLQGKIEAAGLNLQTRLASDAIGIATQRASALADQYVRAALAAERAAAAGRGGGAPAAKKSTGTITAGGQTIKLATGGYVTGPTNALIGEGGESEYVVPESKMGEAMQRYAAGARGAAVIPGSANVNVSYSGSIVSMGGSDYISKGDVPGLLSSAVNQTLKTLQT